MLNKFKDTTKKVSGAVSDRLNYDVKNYKAKKVSVQNREDVIRRDDKSFKKERMHTRTVLADTARAGLSGGSLYESMLLKKRRR